MHTLNVCIPGIRLRIVPLSMEDAESIQRVLGDAEVMQYVPEIAQPFSATAWVNERLNEPMCYICHVVRLAATDELIGYVQVSRRRDTYLELGYLFGKRFWGQRYGPEAVLHTLQLVLSITEQPIYATVYAGNERSVRLLKGIGFRQAPSNSKEGATDFVLG